MTSSGQRWKRQERVIAAALGGVRLPSNGRGQADVVAGRYAIQVKTRGTLPAWFTDAVAQAERDAGPDAVPVVVLSVVRQGTRARRYVVLGFDAWAALTDELDRNGGT